MIRTEVTLLTPELAASFLAKNRTNRPVSKTTVTLYERAIKRGEWALNGEPIIIYKNDTLGDGQHRCMAVVRTGIAINTVVMYGVEQDTFGTLNSGKTRNSSDILAINGELNARHLASAARAILQSELTGTDIYRLTPLQIEKSVREHPHLRYWVQKYAGAAKVRLIPASLCGLLTMASEKYGFEKLDAFFDQLSTGENLSQGDPALVLRERIMAQSGASKISSPHVKAFIVKAINAHLLGKKLTFLRFLEGEMMPKIV